MSGLGDIDPSTMTTAMTVAAIAQGFLAMEAPELNLRLYGIKEKSLYTQTFCKYMGASILSVGVMSLCLFTLELEARKAIVWGLIVWACTHLQAIFNQVPTKLGHSPIGQGIWALICIFSFHAVYTNAPYTFALFIATDVADFVGCLAAIISPAAFMKMYGCKKLDKLTDDQIACTQAFGYEAMALCMFRFLLTVDVEPHVALGIVSLPVMAHMLHGLLGPAHLSPLGSALFAGWLAFHAANFTMFALPELEADMALLAGKTLSRLNTFSFIHTTH